MAAGGFKYALRMLKHNSTSFKTSRCYKLASNRKHKSMNGLTKRGFNKIMRNGIPNKCQMLINDVDKKLGSKRRKFKCSAASFYIDLCKNPPMVIEDEFSLGGGTCKRGNGYRNKGRLGTTLIGAFLTHNYLFNFKPPPNKGREDPRFPKLRKKLRDLSGSELIPAVAAIGLQETNNTAAQYYKYAHVDTVVSEGCISLPPRNHYMVRSLAQNGPSLVVNYKKGSMKPVESCSR